MHDERVDCIVYNAFNGFGDITGSDDFGYSVAWVDLDDHLEPIALDNPEAYETSDDISAYVKTWEDIVGCRYALAYIDSYGVRRVVGYRSRDDMMSVFQELESTYLEWEGN